MITSESLFNRWLALDVASFPTSTFYFMIPLIVVLPYGWSLVSEIRSGYTKNIIVRTTRKIIFIQICSKFLVSSICYNNSTGAKFLMLGLFIPSLKWNQYIRMVQSVRGACGLKFIMNIRLFIVLCIFYWMEYLQG